MKSQIMESLIFLTSLYPHSKVTQETLVGYTEILSEKLSAEELRAAFGLIAERCKFFPTIADIVEIAKGSALDNAHESVELIFKAVKKHGRYQYKEAMKELPEELIGAIQAFGGWTEVCNIESDQMGTARAQLREIAKTYHKRKDFKAAIKQDNLTRLEFSDLKLVE